MEKTDEQYMRGVIAAEYPSIELRGKPFDYVRGFYEQMIKTRAERKLTEHLSSRARPKSADARFDAMLADGDRAVDEARTRELQRMKNAWKPDDVRDAELTSTLRERQGRTRYDADDPVERARGRSVDRMRDAWKDPEQKATERDELLNEVIEEVRCDDAEPRTPDEQRRADDEELESSGRSVAR